MMILRNKQKVFYIKDIYKLYNNNNNNSRRRALLLLEVAACHIQRSEEQCIMGDNAM